MLSEIDIGGVYVAPIAVYGVVALPIAFAARWALWRARILRLLPYASMVTLCLYVSVLALLIRYA